MVSVSHYEQLSIPLGKLPFGTASASGLGHGGHDDELALAGESVALIRSPAMKGNGHATILR